MAPPRKTSKKRGIFSKSNHVTHTHRYVASASVESVKWDAVDSKEGEGRYHGKKKKGRKVLAWLSSTFISLSVSPSPHGEPRSMLVAVRQSVQQPQHTIPW